MSCMYELLKIGELQCNDDLHWPSQHCKNEVCQNTPLKVFSSTNLEKDVRLTAWGDIITPMLSTYQCAIPMGCHETLTSNIFLWL